MLTLIIRGAVWVTALLTGAVFFFLLFIAGKRNSDKGFIFFLFPLVPGFLYTVIEFLYLAFSLHMSPRAAGCLAVSESVVFMCMGLSCVFFYEAHYRLNGIFTARLLPFPLFTVLTAVNFLLFFTGMVFPDAAPFLERTVGVLVYAVLVYAGTTTILILRFNNHILMSSWAGVASAGIGMLYFPFIAILDIFQLNMPITDPFRPVRLQVYAVYYLLVCVVVCLFFIRFFYRGNSGKEEVLPELTRREREFLSMLSSGMSNREIAHTLNISFSTVKTHTANIYRKTGVHSRSELSGYMNRDSGG